MAASARTRRAVCGDGRDSGGRVVRHRVGLRCRWGGAAGRVRRGWFTPARPSGRRLRRGLALTMYSADRVEEIVAGTAPLRATPANIALASCVVLPGVTVIATVLLLPGLSYRP